MKRIILTLATMIMLAISSVCSATPGKVLDAEIMIVDKFIAAANYKAVEPMLTVDYKKDLNEENYNNFKEFSSKNFGVMDQKILRRITKFDDADMLEYRVSFDRMPVVAYIFVFEVDKEKPLLKEFSFQLPQQAQPQK